MDLDNLLLIALGALLGAVVAAASLSSLDDSKLKDCAKKNNVYACELIIVPKE